MKNRGGKRGEGVMRDQLKQRKMMGRKERKDQKSREEIKLEVEKWEKRGGQREVKKRTGG